MEKNEAQVTVTKVTDPDLELFDRDSCLSPSTSLSAISSTTMEDDMGDKHNPYWLAMSRNPEMNTDPALDGSFDILELLHTIILILSIVILIMIFNLFFSESQPQVKE